MLYYVKTPTGEIVYDDVDLSVADAAKRTSFLNRVANMQTWLNANANVKFSALSGAALIAYNAAVAFLQTAGAQFIQTHVVQRNGAQINLATATYAGMWDGRQPYVRTLLGAFPATGIGFMGWPQTDVPPDPPVPPTQGQIDAINAAAVARQAAQDQWRVDAQVQLALGSAAFQVWFAANPYPA
jgi:hypothetical protein